jgi:peptidoglycan/xylan/chitin deacetylase (PgdA/CDA1 family)
MLAIRPQLFARHCSWFTKRRNVVTVEEAIPHITRWGGLPSGWMALTFDDGFQDCYEFGFPILRECRLRATFFVVASMLEAPGRSIDWVDDPVPETVSTLSIPQVLEMQEGGMSFGSHGYRHSKLTELGDKECERELRMSREILEDVLERRVHMLAYPRGEHNELVRKAARRAGFTSAFATSRRLSKVEPYALPRAGIYRIDTDRTLRVKTSSWYIAVRRSPLFSALRRIVTPTDSYSG